MKLLLALFNLLSGLILIRFTVSKFAAWPISVAAFEDMAKPLGIDPTVFRITTGFIIGIAALSFFINCVIILLKWAKNAKVAKLFAFNNLYALGAMTGALFSEFFLRTGVKWMLVYIAIGVISVSLANLASYRKSILNAFPKEGGEANS